MERIVGGLVGIVFNEIEKDGGAGFFDPRLGKAASGLEGSADYRWRVLPAANDVTAQAAEVLEGFSNLAGKWVFRSLEGLIGKVRHGFLNRMISAKNLRPAFGQGIQAVMPDFLLCWRMRVTMCFLIRSFSA